MTRSRAMPMTVKTHRLQFEPNLCPSCRPTLTRRLQGILYQMPTSACDDPGANRPVPCQVCVVAPRRTVARVVAERAPYGLPWWCCAPGVRRRGLPRGDDGVGGSLRAGRPAGPASAGRPLSPPGWRARPCPQAAGGPWAGHGLQGAGSGSRAATTSSGVRGDGAVGYRPVTTAHRC